MRWFTKPKDATPVEELQLEAMHAVIDALRGEPSFEDIDWCAFAVVAQADGRAIARVDAIYYDDHGHPDEMILSTRRMRPYLQDLLLATEGPDESLWQVAVLSYHQPSNHFAMKFYRPGDAEPYLMSPERWEAIAELVRPPELARD
ncbi:hypothetical protein H9L10_14940 [Phycicoccus endophyticus]|uniref:DUF600 family protein n=1 Tax=Phycicoccus endophyticus TaxID=1690220 RepID=A0A7G9R1I2_9MICO|nr:hypothetical protein [Phycicoccus endophyticus]NHI18756.1 hypothetical protein [Phycicoccus endophyticus]QNN49457.1 hypothetical protein H9L10_14940 [Phycicoccus endophyticus]GGL36767.1 hypothetical protein GCM10012283_19050 [Phycicoccus endophyticus]